MLISVVICFSGDLLILMAQIMFATKIIYEEKFIRKHSTHPMVFLGCEGKNSGVLQKLIVDMMCSVAQRAAISGITCTSMVGSLVENLPGDIQFLTLKSTALTFVLSEPGLRVSERGWSSDLSLTRYHRNISMLSVMRRSPSGLHVLDRSTSSLHVLYRSASGLQAQSPVGCVRQPLHICSETHQYVTMS